MSLMSVLVMDTGGHDSHTNKKSFKKKHWQEKQKFSF